MILAIYGSGGQGRHTADLAFQIDRKGKRWDEIVFVDDFKPSEGSVVNGRVALPLEVLLARYSTAEIEFVVSVGDPADRKMLYEKLVDKGCQFANLIHPDVYVPETTSMGKGCVVCQGSIVDCNASIDDNVYMSTLASVGHDSTIGKNCFIACGSRVAGHCDIGSGTYIGQNAAVKEGTTVGDRVVVSQAAAVYRDVENDLIVVGNPARPSRRNMGEGVFSK